MARTVDEQQHEQMTLRAFEAVRKGGVAGLSMARIARDLGVKRSTLYWYFGNLGELFEAVLRVILERQAIFVAGEVAEQSHPIDQILAWIHGVQRFYGKDPELLPILIQLWAVGRPAEPEHAIAATIAQFEPLRQAAVDVLEEGMRDGTVLPCDPGTVVDLCATLIDGSLIHRVSRNLQPDAVTALFVACVLTPLRSPTTPGCELTGADLELPEAGTRSRQAAMQSEQTPQERDRRTWLEED
ncbi:MAG: TetR/AcrR family transcriptional regulator [Myxococcales bacterium]|nr:TetR/AcrR family transcriptional regulator [Myxococcales bacterium]